MIRGKILLAFERAEEMAAALAEMSRMALAHDFRHIDPRDAQILLYEAAPRVLSDIFRRRKCGGSGCIARRR